MSSRGDPDGWASLSLPLIIPSRTFLQRPKFDALLVAQQRQNLVIGDGSTIIIIVIYNLNGETPVGRPVISAVTRTSRGIGDRPTRDYWPDPHPTLRLTRARPLRVRAQASCTARTHGSARHTPQTALQTPLGATESGDLCKETGPSYLAGLAVPAAPTAFAAAPTQHSAFERDESAAPTAFERDEWPIAFGRDANVRWIRAEESENASATLDTIPNTPHSSTTSVAHTQTTSWAGQISPPPSRRGPACRRQWSASRARERAQQAVMATSLLPLHIFEPGERPGRRRYLLEERSHRHLEKPPRDHLSVTTRGSARRSPRPRHDTMRRGSARRHARAAAATRDRRAAALARTHGSKAAASAHTRRRRK
jgi:hypothetical protein